MNQGLQSDAYNLIIRQEKQLHDKVDSIDLLADLIDDEFIEIGSSAAYCDKAEVIRWLLEKNHSECIGHAFKAQLLSDSIILLTYISDIKDKIDGTIKQAMRSSIWRLTEGRWRMVFHQGTPLK